MRDAVSNTKCKIRINSANWGVQQCTDALSCQSTTTGTVERHMHGTKIRLKDSLIHAADFFPTFTFPVLGNQTCSCSTRLQWPDFTVPLEKKAIIPWLIDAAKKPHVMYTTSSKSTTRRTCYSSVSSLSMTGITRSGIKSKFHWASQRINRSAIQYPRQILEWRNPITHQAWPQSNGHTSKHLILICCVILYSSFSVLMNEFVDVFEVKKQFSDQTETVLWPNKQIKPQQMNYNFKPKFTCTFSFQKKVQIDSWNNTGNDKIWRSFCTKREPLQHTQKWLCRSFGVFWRPCRFPVKKETSSERDCIKRSPWPQQKFVSIAAKGTTAPEAINYELPFFGETHRTWIQGFAPSLMRGKLTQETRYRSVTEGKSVFDKSVRDFFRDATQLLLTAYSLSLIGGIHCTQNRTASRFALQRAGFLLWTISRILEALPLATWAFS